LIVDERMKGRLLGQFATMGWIGGLGAALAMWWIAPFYKKLDYTNDMGWEKLTTYTENLFGFAVAKKPAGASVFAIACGLAVVATLWSVFSLLRALFVTMKRNPGDWHGPAAAFCGAVGLLVGLGIVRMWKIDGMNVGYQLLIAAGVGIMLTATFVGPFLENWHRLCLVFVFSAGLSAALFRFAPQFRLWNARVLPFWMLSVYMLGGFGMYAICRMVDQSIKWLSNGQRSTRNGPVIATAAAGLLTYSMVALPLGMIPEKAPFPKYKDGLVGFQQAGDSNDYKASSASSWPRHNYGGYESKPSWQDFKSINDAMLAVGKQHGCGRAHWEYESEQDRWGTPMALMTLPMWTNSCISSMEGLYFESSATTPYHFMNAGLLDKAPSNPQRNLPYEGMNVEKGVRRLQWFGVRYYMAFSKAATDQANALPNLLTPLATSPYKRTCKPEETQPGDCPTTWTIYQIADSDNVAPLPFQPAVVTGIGQSQQNGWLDFGSVIYKDDTKNKVPFAADGPKEWERVKVTVKDRKPGTGTYGDGVSFALPKEVPLEPVTVTNIKKGRDNVSFTVDKIGIPVAVRTSYFPNFDAKGAKGPYRLAPNTMVVVPTSNNVEIRWKNTGADYFGQFLTAAGLAGCVALWVLGKRARRLATASASPGGADPTLPGTESPGNAPAESRASATVSVTDPAVSDSTSYSTNYTTNYTADDAEWLRSLSEPQPPTEPPIGGTHIGETQIGEPPSGGTRAGPTATAEALGEDSPPPPAQQT
jgi:hypothetical protein